VQRNALYCICTGNAAKDAAVARRADRRPEEYPGHRSGHAVWCRAWRVRLANNLWQGSGDDTYDTANLFGTLLRAPTPIVSPVLFPGFRPPPHLSAARQDRGRTSLGRSDHMGSTNSRPWQHVCTHAFSSARCACCGLARAERSAHSPEAWRRRWLVS